jgi:hypothetical protein
MKLLNKREIQSVRKGMEDRKGTENVDVESSEDKRKATNKRVGKLTENSPFDAAGDGALDSGAPHLHFHVI